MRRRRGRPLACGAVVKIYTRKGDDGTTGLYFGGRRVPKDSPAISVNGDVDEAQSMLGLARAEAETGSELDELLLDLERDLWVLMAEVATAPENRHKLVAGASLVTHEMVAALESRIDMLNERFEMPTEFVMPGQNRVAAALDVARTVVRRAERGFIAVSGARAPTVDAPRRPRSGRRGSAGSAGSAGTESSVPDSQVGPYLNRLSDLLWTMARWQEGEHIAARSLGHGPGAS